MTCAERVSRFYIVVVASFVAILVVASYQQDHTAMTTKATCEYLGTGTVEEIVESGQELNNAGFGVVRVKLRKDSTTQEPEWKVLVPAAMAFAQGDKIDLCGYYYQPHPQATHFIPIVTRLTSPTK